MEKSSEEKSPLVVVAMSGGVDSSLAAFLLNQQGYQTVGISMKLWDFKDVGGETYPDGRCCSLEAINDARAVCQKMGIAHYVVDMRDDFKREVISDFVREYLNGRTPNPCIVCNIRIKWGSLWKKAESLGASSIATGHYARIRYDRNDRRFKLSKGMDQTRDQSYALWGLCQEDLSRTMFPLGELTKKQVRALARKHRLKVADREESQEICFVADDDYTRFLNEWEKREGQGSRSEIRPGPILSTSGKSLGRHKGIAFYTVGQRRGLGIAAGKPLYVVQIDAKENAIYVGENQELFRSSFVASDVNWLSIDKLKNKMDCEIKIRYQHIPQDGEIHPLADDKVRVKFNRPERAITPGQSAVFYQGDVVLGGGIIERVVDN